MHQPLRAIVTAGACVVVSAALLAAKPAPPPLETSALFTLDGNRAGAWMGYSVASIGDQNGDGRSDILVTAPDINNPVHTEPCAFLLSPAQGSEISRGGVCAALVADAGDVNGDGRRDLLAAIWMPERRVELYYGPLSNDFQADWVARTPSGVFDGFGQSIAGAGDVNGDGFDDLIVGVPGAYGSGSNGRVLVYLGSPSGPSASPDIVLEGTWPEGRFGETVAGAGDVNGDGYDDVIVGAPRYLDPEQHGAAYVYMGGPSGLATTPAWSTTVNMNSAFTGQAVASAGDVNHDGFADVIVGDNSWRSRQRGGEGHAAVFLGTADGLSQSPAWSVYGDYENGGFGRAVASLDVNCDGYSDVVVGAWASYSPTKLRRDRVLLFLGSSGGLSTTAAWTVSMPQGNDTQGFGFAISSAGDVNGDGSDDLVVGAPYLTADQQAEGRVFVYASTRGCAR